MIEKKYIRSSPFIEVTRTIYRDGVIMTPHNHNHTAISFVLSGAIHETVNESTGVGNSCNVVIKPSKIVHNNVFSNDCTIVSIYLKHQNNLKIRSQDILKEWGWIQGGSCQSLVYNLIESETERQYYKNINELLDLLKEQKSKTEFSTIPKWLQEVKYIIDTSYHEVLKSKEIAKWVGVHPIYLSRMFLKYFGQSIKSYLTTVRVNNAMAAIISEEEYLTEVAYNTGFFDQSHFNRMFKTETGITPGDFKRLVK